MSRRYSGRRDARAAAEPLHQTLVSLAEHYVDGLAEARPEPPDELDWRARTATVNRGAVKRLLPHFGPKRLADIRARDVTVYVRDALLEYAPATVNLDVNVLVDIFNSAIREALVQANPALLVERPRIPRRNWRILEPAEVARVAKAFTDEQARVVFLTLVLTGIRRFELEALRWRDIDLLESVIRVRDSKTEEGIRSIALSPRLA
ncbi:MAG TPA: hypothetical protein VHF67_02270 [Gaiellaceae bacterium]|nr:hypothetical protein [Gaiellaceae bacterium]